jgi:hypothetical protein
MRRFCCKNNTIPVFGSGAGRASVVPKHGHNNHYAQLCLSKWRFAGPRPLVHRPQSPRTAYNRFCGCGQYICTPRNQNAPCRASTSLVANRSPLTCRRSGCFRHKTPKSDGGGLAFRAGETPPIFFNFPLKAKTV